MMDRVADQGSQHLHTVPGGTRGTSKIYHQCDVPIRPLGRPGQSPGQHRGPDLSDPGKADRLGDAGQLPGQTGTGAFRGQVPGSDPGTAESENQVGFPVQGPFDCVRDTFGSVRDQLGRDSSETGRGKSLDRGRPGTVLPLPGRRPVRNGDHGHVEISGGDGEIHTPTLEDRTIHPDGPTVGPELEGPTSVTARPSRSLSPLRKEFGMFAESARAVRVRTTDHLVLVADLAATALFSLEGSLVAIAADLDLFGILVVGFATALGGGITRDMIIGSGPPLAMRFMRYPVAALTAAALAILVTIPAWTIPDGLLVTLDAGGLALFAVSGAKRAIDHGLNDVSATLLGVLTGVGGGVIQAVLLSRVPAVLTEQIYASAALAGLIVMLVGIRKGVAPGRMMVIGALTCFTLRVISWNLGWSLPTFAG